MAEIYQYQGHDGVICYSNKPPNPSGRYFVHKIVEEDENLRKHEKKMRWSQKVAHNASSKTTMMALKKDNTIDSGRGSSFNKDLQRPPGRAERKPSENPIDEIKVFIADAAKQFQLPEALLKAMVKVESNYNPLAVSNKGATGLMQIMPMNFSSLNIDDPFDPKQNIAGGARYFKQMLRQFDGDVALALAAYNAGPYAVERYGHRLPYPETRLYVKKVLKYYEKYKK